MTLSEYVDASWSDVIADRADEVGSALRDHLERGPRLPDVTVAPESGLVDGIRYEARGGGPPLVLLPLGLAPSQWEPVIEGSVKTSALSRSVALSWAWWRSSRSGLGVSGTRACSVISWRRPASRRVNVSSRWAVVAARCCAGSPGRPLVRTRSSALTSIAICCAKRVPSLRAGTCRLHPAARGDAQHLPLQDGEFDLTLCITVLEEGDADRMLREIVRVTRPGGHVAIMVRSIDMPWWVNIPVSDEIKAKAGGGGGWCGRGRPR